MPFRSVCVFVPTVGRGDDLTRTVASLMEQSAMAQIVIVDNGSRDGSVAAARRAFPEVDVVELSENRGFGPALNAAVRERPARTLVFANDDVRYEPRFLEALLDEVGGEEASVAGLLLDAQAPGTIDSAGVIVDETLLAFDYLQGLPIEAAEDAEAPLGPTGGAALVPLEAFEAVGGFDERIFAYLEDVDLALRMRTLGIRCRLAPAARGVHRHSATLGSGSSRKNELMGWSRGYLLRRYRVLRDPRLAVRAVATEATICVGQAVVDRNVSGTAGRLRGWGAAKGLPPNPIPPGSTTDVSFAEALRRRAARRPSLAARVRPRPAVRS